MSEVNQISKAIHQPVPVPSNTTAEAVNEVDKGQSHAPVSNKAAFEKILNRQALPEKLLDPNILVVPLANISSGQLAKNASKVPRPNAMESACLPLGHMSNQSLLTSIMQGKDQEGNNRFHGILRQESDIASSGVLAACRELASRGIEVPASELNRSIADDSVLVLSGFARMSANQIHQLKEKAYHHPEVEPEKQGALEKGYFGSAKHKEFGALVESMTGGILSAEEAMAMCPCGGIPGPGAKEVPLISGIDAVQRHAMRHDALGFLFTRFQVGPGYGSKTTPLGLASDNPMAGQVLGIAREIFKESSVFPASDHIARPERFQA